MARRSSGNPQGGLIARGTCEGCKLDLGNRLDPLCWRCHEALERVTTARRLERLQERLDRLLAELERIA